MLCGHFILSAAHEGLIRSYPPRRLILHAPENSAAAAAPATDVQVVGLVSHHARQSATENLGSLAMLNALSTALFAIAPAESEVTAPPDGLLVLRSIQMIQRTPLLAFPTKAGIHFCRGHRLSPVKRD
jgi:AraC family transcriptional regulator, activator of mtrCDE